MTSQRAEDPDARDSEDYEPETSVVGTSKPRLLQVLGPGLITGASDDDPSGIATYSQVGAQFGYGLGWIMLFSYPLMCAVQMIAARIGRTTDHGIAGNLRRYYPVSLTRVIVVLLFIANVINLGADLGAMGEAVTLLVPGSAHLYVVVFGVICIVMQVFMQYAQYVRVLKWLTLALFAYIATLFAVDVDWVQLARDLALPPLQWDDAYLTGIVAVLGTTISPYLFFWQASQEVEEMNQGKMHRPLRELTKGGYPELDRIKIDTIVGMIFSNAIAFFIILTTATVLNANGVTNINSATQAAEALRPLAGDFTFLLFALGIIGTGMLAIPVLAGSAAYGVSEAFGWHATLEAKAPDAVGFYTIIAAATVIGFGLGFTGIDSIHMLVWSAVLNGIVAVPIMAMMMVIVANSRLMGRFRARSWLIALGWVGTGLMALAVIALIGSSLAG
jgi:NRAMP (natural resistance-associated macrophage protein)-like metal ion transporter